MKILRTGTPRPKSRPWYLDAEFTCQDCGTVVRVEQGDFVHYFQNFMLADTACCACPTCSGTCKATDPAGPTMEQILNDNGVIPRQPDRWRRLRIRR